MGVVLVHRLALFEWECMSFLKLVAVHVVVDVVLLPSLLFFHSSIDPSIHALGGTITFVPAGASLKSVLSGSWVFQGGPSFFLARFAPRGSALAVPHTPCSLVPLRYSHRRQQPTLLGGLVPRNMNDKLDEVLPEYLSHKDVSNMSVVTTTTSPILPRGRRTFRHRNAAHEASRETTRAVRAAESSPETM